MTEPTKSRPVREPSTGKFESPSPATDPQLRRFSNEVVRCVHGLQLPIMLAIKFSKTEDERKTHQAVLGYLTIMAQCHEAFLDPETGPGPLQPEVIQRIAEKWADQVQAMDASGGVLK